MDKIRFLGAENEISRVPFGSILKETREKTTVENEDTLLSCAINGIFRNDELFSHFRGSSTIGYIKVKKNDLILSAQNLHLGNANVNLRFEHGIISPAYKVYRITGAEPEYIAQWVKRPAANQFFLAATTEGASQCRKNIDWDALYRQPIVLPSSNEQKKIAKLLMSLDSQIAFEKTEVRKLKDFKSAMLTKIFPKEGKTEPEIRFSGFTDAWEQRKFSDITFPAGEKNRDNLPLESYSITNEHGFIPQDEKFENGGTMREADKRMYYIVSPNSFAYNPARINVGSIGYQNTGKDVIVSSLYEVFKTSDDVDDRFLWHWFKSPDFQKLIFQLQEGGVRLYFYYDKLCMGTVSLPSLEEQRKIGQFFDSLDTLITLHQRKYEKLIDTKKAFLEKLIGGEK